MNSFADTFRGRFEAFLSDHNLVPTGSHLLLGVSGGLDSMAMLHLFHSSHRADCQISVIHVNHQLRGEESDADERFVREAAETLGIPFFSRRVNVPEYKKNAGISFQEAARELRYRCYEEVRLLIRANAVATAHHADDNAETVLLNALRGAGIRGLAGIPIKRAAGRIIRPLLFATRAELRRYVEEMKIEFREDSSNASSKYARNFLRHEFLESLGEVMQADMTASLNRVSAIMQSMAERLNGEVLSRFDSVVAKDGNQYTISIPTLTSEPLYLQEELLLRLFRMASIEPSVRKIQASLSLINLPTGKSVRLQKDWSLYRDRDRLLLATAQETGFRYDLIPDQEYKFPGFRFAIKHIEEHSIPDDHESGIEYVDAGRLKSPLTIRTWRPGDTFVPFGMANEKKLSDFFTDEKIPLPRKRATPLLESDGTIVWVCGLRLDNRFRVTSRTQSIARLEYSHNLP